MLKVVLALALLWLFATDSGRQFWDGILKGMNVESNIAAYDCDKVVDLVRGESLQNAFGGTFKIIEITNVRAGSHGADAITCTGDVTVSNGSTQRMTMSARKSRNSDEIIYEVKPM